MSGSFEIGRLPEVVFGNGALERLPAIVALHGRRALLVTGARSLRSSPHWAPLLASLDGAGVEHESLAVAGEPSPELVDAAVRRFARARIDVVVGIGGGSAIDTAKAVAGLLRSGRSVLDHLEGVGRGVPYAGPAVPLVAVPTTAGTGSEATRNAVLGMRGAGGFKKSFRDAALVARHAILDPGLVAGCPPEVLAADGMDALTQLLESYTSSRASPFTDALAECGLAAVREGLLPLHVGGPGADAARARMLWAAHLSGVCLAHAGLGIVHGLASPLGALFPVPHGAVCGTLLAEATAMNIDALQARAPRSPALARYARAAEILFGAGRTRPEAAHAALVGGLRDWTERLALPRLARYGIGADAIGRVVAASGGASARTNPVTLEDEEVAEIVRRRL